jgi:hypothetical protein
MGDTATATVRAGEQQASDGRGIDVTVKKVVLEPAAHARLTAPPHPVVVVVERDLMIGRPARVVGLVEAELEALIVNRTPAGVGRPTGAQDVRTFDPFP